MAQLTVFNTPELLETILLHLPLNELLQIQGVCVTWKQTILASPKLATVLGLHPLKGSVKRNYLTSDSFTTVYNKASQRLQEAPPDHASSATLEWLRPSMPWALRFKAEFCLSHFVANRIKWRGVACNVFLPAVFPLNREYAYPDGHPGYFFSYSQQDSDPECEYHGSWEGMYVTQPPTTCLVLRPEGLEDIDHPYWSLSREVQEDVKKCVIITNESGVKFDDVAEALYHLERKFTPIIAHVEAEEQGRKQECMQAREKFKLEHGYEWQEDEENKQMALRMEELYASGEFVKYTPKDLWGCFYFRLLVPRETV